MKKISKICLVIVLATFFNVLQTGIEGIIMTTCQDIFGRLTVLDRDRDLKSHTHHVAVITEATNRSLLWCGGSFVSKNHVLTAAHCLERSDNATIMMYDQSNKEKHKHEYKVQSSNFKIHPKWQSNLLLNDIALIELPQTLDIPNLSHISLVSTTKITSNQATVYGWEKNYSSQPKLVKHEATIISNKECKKIYGSLVTKNVFCAKGIGCHGFSGGGLVVDGFLVGVVSFGTDQCNIGYPTVYTRVSRYKKWIERNGV